MLTFTQITENPTLLDSYRWDSFVEVSCTYCGTPHLKNKEKLRRALKLGQQGVYCSVSCSRKHLHERAISKRGGVTGRFCKECGEWKPLTQMGNAGKQKTCNTCWEKRPLQKFNGYRRAATKRGWSFKVTYEQFMSFWQKPCVYCGEDIETIGMDRMDNEKGYEISNIVPCCTWCNYAKRQLSREMFLAKCRAVAAMHPTP